LYIIFNYNILSDLLIRGGLTCRYQKKYSKGFLRAAEDYLRRFMGFTIFDF